MANEGLIIFSPLEASHVQSMSSTAVHPWGT